MGTRGAYGFVLNGREIATYNHYDSYPEGLGVEVLGFVSETSDKELRQIAEGIELVDESFKPTKEQVEACKEWTDLGVSNQSVEDWYCLLRKAQGNFLALKNGLRFMIDSSTFLLDSLFCEWAYLINLDTGKLEVYEGFNKNPLAAGRYAQFTVDRELRYYGVALLDEVPFEEARKLTADQFVERVRGEVKVDE
jgi:hypothetical protein